MTVLGVVKATPIFFEMLKDVISNKYKKVPVGSITVYGSLLVIAVDD